MKSFDLVCFGEILHDVYETKKVLAGAPLNTASFASFFGLKTALISAIGNKKEDKHIEDELMRRNIEPFLQRNIYPTGSAKIELDKNKAPTFRIEQNSAYDYIRKTKTLIDLVNNTEFFYFGTLSQRQEVSRNTLMELLSETQATTVYDINLRKGIPVWNSIVKRSLKSTIILKVNERESDEAKALFGSQDFAKLFGNTNIRYVFVTLGKKGACLYQKGKGTLFVSSPKVNVVDTTGCGDAFTAAVICGFYKKWSTFKILKFAVEFSSQVAQYEGAFDSKFFVESGINLP